MCQNSFAFSSKAGQFRPKLQVEGDGPIHYSWSQKMRWSGRSCSIRILTEGSLVLSHCTVHAFDRWTDRQTEFNGKDVFGIVIVW